MTDEEYWEYEAKIWKATERYIKDHPYDYGLPFVLDPPCLCAECKAIRAAEMNFFPDWGF